MGSQSADSGGCCGIASDSDSDQSNRRLSYKKMLARFSSTDAGLALRLFLDPVYSSLMGGRVGEMQWAELLDILEPKLTSSLDRNLMTAIRGFPGTPDKLRLDTKIQRLAETKA